MHELSLAQNIVESIRENVTEERLPLVRQVKISIGIGSGVVDESLVFAFDAIVKDSVLSSARLRPETIPFVVRCNECHRESENESGFMVCKYCESPDVSVVSGTELILRQIELIE